MSRRRKHRVVGTAEILFTATRRDANIVISGCCRSDPVELRPFLVGEKLLPGEHGGSLQGCLVVLAPYSLQVRVAPGGRQRRLPCSGALTGEADSSDLQDDADADDQYYDTKHLEESPAHSASITLEDSPLVPSMCVYSFPESSLGGCVQ